MMEKINLKNLSDEYYRVAIENLKNANQFVGHLQNWLLIFSIAELTFLGSTLQINFNKEQSIFHIPIILLIVVAICLASVNFLFFFLGSHSQYRHVLKSARSYLKLCKDTKDFCKKINEEVDELPQCLSDKHLAEITSDKWANRFFSMSMLCIFLATVVIVIIFPFLFSNNNASIGKVNFDMQSQH